MNFFIKCCCWTADYVLNNVNASHTASFKDTEELSECISSVKNMIEIVIKIVSLPAIREYLLGSLIRSTQWAGVTAHMLLTREAPQMWTLFILSDSCHGHELGVAVWPPTMREPPGRCPHEAESNIQWTTMSIA